MRFNLPVLLVALITFSYASPAKAADIIIPGTGDGVAVLNAVAAAFRLKTGLDTEIPESVGSNGGIVLAGSDQAELARVAREIKEKEQSFGLTYLPVFKVPTVFYVTQDVAVKNLSSAQILDIFSGKIVDWSEAGGKKEAIKVVVRESGDSSYNNLQQSFPGFKDLILSKKAITALKTPHMVTIMQHEKNSIGFGPLDVALANGMKFISVDGIKPTDAGYQYFGTIGLVYKPQKLSVASKKFLDFISSKEAHPAIRDFGGIVIN